MMDRMSTNQPSYTCCCPDGKQCNSLQKELRELGFSYM